LATILEKDRREKLEMSRAIMDLDQKLIEEIIGRILNVTQPERIILFGSAARGK